MEAEYLPFDKALLASDDFCGHCTRDKVFRRRILAGLSHGPRRARCCDYAPMWLYAVAGAQRDGDFRDDNDTCTICATLAGAMTDESGSPLL